MDNDDSEPKVNLPKKPNKREPQLGVKAAADILNNLDPEARERLLSNIARENPKLAVEMQAQMFGFEDLALMADADLRFLLQEVPQPKLVLALRLAGEECKAAIFKNVSGRTGQYFKEEMLAQGPQKKADVLDAQARIVEIARKLSAEGKIHLRPEKPSEKK